MRVQRCASTDAFVVYDLDGAPSSVGVVRSAPKILLDGAVALARTNTYAFAAFGERRGGASAGVNAPPDARAAAVAAFVEEVAPEVTSGALALDAGKGVAEAELAGVRAADTRDPSLWRMGSSFRLVEHALGVSAATAAAAAVGLDGRSVAVEVAGVGGLAVASECLARGATIAALATSEGVCVPEASCDSATLTSAWAAHGPELVAHLGAPAPSTLWAMPADVLLCGSRVGMIDHEIAADVAAAAVVPVGPIPLTAKAFAALRRRGVVYVPDFVSLAGGLLVGWASDAPAAALDAVAARVDALVREVAAHPDGLFLAGCVLAESFLRTWRDELPFGRPLA